MASKCCCVCVGGEGVQVGGATVGGWRSKGVWCHNQDPGSISVVWG